MSAVELDQLASLARTALDDPHGLPEGALDDSPDGRFSPSVRRAYAIARLDEIINALNPAEITRENAAQALRTLGRHIAAVGDRLDEIGMPWPLAGDVDRADDHLTAALDELDLAIDELDPPDDFTADEEAGR